MNKPGRERKSLCHVALIAVLVSALCASGAYVEIGPHNDRRKAFPLPQGVAFKHGRGLLE